MNTRTASAPQPFRSQPMPRQKVGATEWELAAVEAARGRFDLLSLWATEDAVLMALRQVESGLIDVLSYPLAAGVFPSVAAQHPAAQRLERAIHDLHGHRAEAAPDTRAWLDHGRWGIAAPLGAATPGPALPPYEFLPVEGESLHQVAVGPVHAGIIEPGHFRFTAQGEAVVRLEARLGYTHKGVDALMRGASLARGAELAGRVSGDSALAYAWAYAQAAESALGAEVPARALYLRTIMAELERLANHLGDIGAICNDAAMAMMLAQCGVLREAVLRAADAAFGHRFLRDRIVPGGVTHDLDARGISTIAGLVARLRDRFPACVALYDGTPSLLGRTVSTGTLAPELARHFGAGGPIGRASGRDFDTRRDCAYAPYDDLTFNVPRRADGDVNARIWIRIREVEQSLALIEQCIARLPAGPVFAAPAAAGEPREGLGLVEGFRGDVLVWLALAADGSITRCHLRDPSWFQWPLLEAVIEGNIIADFPLCNKSFNCSYSGHDL
ncbi:hydrogenase expression protein HypE [Phaeovulum sp.]|jgi:Ni,Fe-hydrogenase III large subunit|uniref:hydrogenase large subunit n=1 Tax=Phaeovulum sp. TaxID=2934796 RepID=UPI0027305917|nr:hydrogenase expression protein HypE [Phaeovulum sp.]MDP1668022.1 hydrogenase expression protein HypE [Phaeovulum sp.]MDZ4119471.1 hydrogenase expression protein HypE [Phaeovulum sp.]